jgi:hypothetical protein
MNTRYRYPVHFIGRPRQKDISNLTLDPHLAATAYGAQQGQPYAFDSTDL